MQRCGDAHTLATSHAHTQSNVLSTLTAGFVADWKGLSPTVAVARVLRASRIFGMNGVREKITSNAAYQRHVAGIAKDDAVFFLSHRHYLAKGLTPSQRAQTALHHYRHEITAFDGAYFDAVYCQNGLTLWRDVVDETSYDIRLMPGNDVLYEGGVSLVMHVNDVRVCVVSYSTVQTEVFFPQFRTMHDGEVLADTTLYVTRKQLTPTHEYQKKFNKAFDRTTPAHLCFGALAGVAHAQGFGGVLGITPEVHLSCTPELRPHFDVAYTLFWEGLSGHRVSPFAYFIELPMKLTPLDHLDAKARKRAIARRSHIHAVRESAHAVLAPLLNPSPRG